ncbi:MAG: DEAD/DEAH box helicase [Candidatus Omnitrophota bacterium]
MYRIGIKGEKIIIIECGYDAFIVAEIRKISGVKWVKEFHHWELIPSVRAIPQLFLFADKFNFLWDFGVREMLEGELKTYNNNLGLNSKTLANIELPGLALPLLPFQVAGVQYLSATQRCFLADHPGLGKTCQALATVEHLDAYPAIVVCPSILKENWRREAEKFLPSRTAVICDNKNYKDINADFVILNYEMLKKYMPYLKIMQPKAVIFDEIHICKDKKRIRSVEARKLSEGIGVRLGLTGTPILSRPSELISQLYILGQMEQFGNEWQFLQRYCSAKKEVIGYDKEKKEKKIAWNFSGVSNAAELNEILRKTCYIRRTKAEVLPELPEKRYSEIEIEIDNLEEYQAASEDIVAYLVEEGHRDKVFLEETRRMSIIDRCDAKHSKARIIELRTRNAEHLVRITALKKIAVRGKLASINAWIDDFLLTGEKLVVFAHHREIVCQLADRKGAVKVLGGAKERKCRQEAIDSFQNDAGTNLIVCSMLAGGVGITLTASSNLAFTELAWTPAIHEQAEDREHRIGQKEAVNVYYFLGKDTIDEDIYSLLQEKKKVVDAVVDGKAVSILSGLVERLKTKGGKP